MKYSDLNIKDKIILISLFVIAAIAFYKAFNL